MALIFEKVEVAFEEEIEFKGYGVDSYNLVLNEEEVANVINLFKKSQEEKANNEELDEELFQIIWKDKLDYYKENLGYYIFNKYTMAIVVEIMGKQSKSDQKFYTNIAKKYQTKK